MRVHVFQNGAAIFEWTRQDRVTERLMDEISRAIDDRKIMMVVNDDVEVVVYDVPLGTDKEAPQE